MAEPGRTRLTPTEACAADATPPEFPPRIQAADQLPADFDARDYALLNPDLGGVEDEQELVRHYLAAGAAENRPYAREFDPCFYGALYLHAQPGLDGQALRDHWRQDPGRYASLAEALARNGFRSKDWIDHFDQQSYAVHNNLVEQLHNPTQSLVHFIETGWRQCLPISGDLAFDRNFHTEMLDTQVDLSTPALYRIWIEAGLPCGAAPNAAAMLRSLGLTLPQYPAGFDWRRYLAERPGLCPGKADKWQALYHLIDTGILAEQPLPVDPAAAPALFTALANRFATQGKLDEAERTYDRVLLAADAPPRALQHAADLALRRGRPARALALYRQVCVRGGAGFWTWANGAGAALALGELDQAEEWTLRGLAVRPRSRRLLDLHRDVQQRRLDAAAARHAELVRAGGADTGLAEVLDRVHGAFRTAWRVQHGDVPRRPLPPGSRLRVAILANQDLPQCTFYRVALKAEQLDGPDAHLEIFERGDAEAFLTAAATADVAIFYRLAASVDVLRCVAACAELGVPTAYEIDDLVFDPAHFPEALESYGGAITAEQHGELRAGVALVDHVLRLCDVGIASTGHLAPWLAARVRSGQVIVHRNGLSEALAKLARHSQPRPAGGSVTVFYGSGTKAHARDFHDQLEPALLRLMRERPEVRFLACGHVDASALAARFPGRVEQVELLADRDAYLSLLLDVDINASVLAATPFNDCKSEIKWLEAAAFAVPSVVSDVGGFRETLAAGEHVVRVAPDPGSWHDALRRLVLDPAERARIGIAARDHAAAEYGPRHLGRQLLDALRRVAAGAAVPGPDSAARSRKRGRPGAPASVPAQPRRRRLLLGNVFFPPQAIGGATRVVADQASVLLDKYADRYELGVLCANDEAAEPYRMEAYAWRGVPVWSINTPHREHMDWQPRDAGVGGPVDAVLDAFRPDLAHFHCMQRLTAAAVERVALRGIPYFVTVHDAWWISDHQFLMDHMDRLRMPGRPERYGTGCNPHTRAASGGRRMALKACLDGAAGVLAVSESFARIYRQAGIGRVRAVPNGLPRLPPLEQAPAPAGRVRLGHLGGMTYHKGFFLLQQALRRGRYDRLDLLVVDHALHPGEERAETWGSTPVRLVGKTAQDRIGWLYGQFDVLVAPSMWPESFGLVAREAAHYRKWVVAGNRGAMAEDVLDGINGLVVDVGRAGALDHALATIQADPERFAGPAPHAGPARGVEDQVAELVALYGDVQKPSERAQ